MVSYFNLDVTVTQLHQHTAILKPKETYAFIRVLDDQGPYATERPRQNNIEILHINWPRPGEDKANL